MIRKKFEKYIRTILDEEWFIELNSKADFFLPDVSDDEKVKAVLEYAERYYKRRNRVDYKRLYVFFEKYSRKVETEHIIKDGYIQFKEEDVIIRNLCGPHKLKGYYLRDVLIGCDGSMYFVKYPLRAKSFIKVKESKGISREVLSESSEYNAIVASYFGKMLGLNMAEYFLTVRESIPQIVSKNFLDSNQRIIDFSDIMLFARNNGNIADDDTYLALREGLRCYLEKKYPNSNIDKILMELDEQVLGKEFLDISDQRPENYSLVVEEKDGREEVVGISPAYDLDISLVLGEAATDVLTRTVKKRQASDNRTANQAFFEDMLSIDKMSRQITVDFLSRNIDKFRNPDEFIKRLFEEIFNTIRLYNTK